MSQAWAASSSTNSTSLELGAVVGEVGVVVRDTDPEGLPECDLLELDCEGAEVEILTRMKIQPRTILVETHGAQGAPTALSRRVLEDRGYDVSDMGFAEPRFPVLCELEDIRVLWAHLATSL